MNRQALVGLFTIFALIGLFAIFVVLANVGPQGRYKIGVHFKSAAGLHRGALVYESGVVVGIVDQTNLLPDDFTVEVILAINNNVDVPRTAKFLIQAPLTGDSTLEIVPLPPSTRPGFTAAANAPSAVAVLPRAILPMDQQPQGTNPATIQDLLDQGQGEVRRLDVMLGTLERREPALLNTLQAALDNAKELSGTANVTFSKLSRRIDTLADTLQLALEQGSADITNITGSLDKTVNRNTGHFDSIIAALDRSAHDLNVTADHITSLATDPQLRANILQTTQGIAQTATTFASIANDLHNVSSNPQTQAQLRDTIAQVDAASQKANSLFSKIGGRSHVYGVDPGATPYPVPAPAAAPGRNQQGPGPVPYPSAAPGSPRGAGPSPSATPNPSTVQADVKEKVGSLVSQLLALQVRVSELDDQHAGTYNSPLLKRDRGPETDVNLVALPQGSTYLFAGVNDTGGPATTWNFAAMGHIAPHFAVGGGLLYSRLGARAIYNPGLNGLGFDALIYDPRHPTADGYLNLRVGGGLQIFGGERDILHSGRRTAFGLQFQF
jgi:ABC-type transporter Mla subunit MlaD